MFWPRTTYATHTYTLCTSHPPPTHVSLNPLPPPPTTHTCGCPPQVPELQRQLAATERQVSGAAAQLSAATEELSQLKGERDKLQVGGGEERQGYWEGAGWLGGPWGGGHLWHCCR
jgi:hypothetical protein